MFSYVCEEFFFLDMVKDRNVVSVMSLQDEQ